ncbi:hypothetical protein EVAR_60811_1 [Eumeta japonica]|uniref:Uncharacterized protein n=1 Tax=Eumeta variegata TaxID=151549 RepID=A0A4C1YMX6_EUMVA|nr:hypothetical protein EVAR_60811_1 [Eumeta japonica]
MVEGCGVKEGGPVIIVLVVYTDTVPGLHAVSTMHMHLQWASIIRTSLNQTTAYPNSSSGGSTAPSRACRSRQPTLHSAVFAHLSRLVRLLLYSYVTSK